MYKMKKLDEEKSGQSSMPCIPPPVSPGESFMNPIEVCRVYNTVKCECGKSSSAAFQQRLRVIWSSDLAKKALIVWESYLFLLQKVKSIILSVSILLYDIVINRCY